MLIFLSSKKAKGFSPQRR